MEELKHKLFGLIKPGTNTKIPSMGFTEGHMSGAPSDGYILAINSKTSLQENRPADQDILNSIEKMYFQNNNDFDPSKHELDKLSETLECTTIYRDFTLLKHQHQVVSKKVLQLILQNQSSCNQEFSHVLDVQAQLKQAVEICREGRCSLALAKKQFTTASLGILANYRKREVVQGLLHSLNVIKSLYNMEGELQELLTEGNYSAAILLLLKCQDEASKYSYFTCVAALSGKMQDTLVMAEEHLDVALAKICYSFDSAIYSKLQDSYHMLSKTQMAMDQLHMHYTSAIHSTAFSIVHGHTETPQTPSQGQKKQYKQLCHCIPQDEFIPCLVKLCKSLWTIMASYYQVVAWHSEAPDNYNSNYITQKLDKGLQRIWQDVQAKISMYLHSANLGNYKFEQVVTVLSIIHRLIEIGEEFCGSKSEDLQDLIRKQSVNYFKNYHASRLEELRIVIENEGWEICPVKSNFNILQLQEFKPLRHILQQFKVSSIFQTAVLPRVPSVSFISPDNSSNHSQDGSSVVGNFFARYCMRGTPFDSRLDDTIIEEDFYVDEASGYFSEESDDSDSKASTNKYVNRQSIPLLTNTTLTVLRHCGRYLQMSRLLRSIAHDIIMCMSQLYEYYFCAVHTCFAADLSISSSSLYSPGLCQTIKRINNTLIEDPNLNNYSLNIDVELDRDRVGKPSLSPMILLNQPENLHGLAERVVAVESLLFLSNQFLSLQSYLEHLTPASYLPDLQRFYEQSVQIAPDLRKPVYMCVAAQSFDLRQMLISMSKVNWEVNDVMIQHSSYIDNLLREIQIFTMRFEGIASRVPIPNDVSVALWENIAHIVTHTLVEGYSNAKKCSTGGRALMQLDFTQFLSKFEKMVTTRPIPHRDYVELYVKAYYLPEAGLESFIKDHPEYSPKHMYGLVTCMYQNNKKARQRLFAVIEELERDRPASTTR